MLFRFILTEIEYFYREKPLHLKTVVQTPSSTNYQVVNCPGFNCPGVNCPWSIVRGLKLMLFRSILTKIEYFYCEKPLHLNAVV